MKLALVCSGLTLIFGVLITFVTGDAQDNGMIPGMKVEGMSKVHKAWYGGFIGEFDIPIQNPASAWSAVLRFKRRVFDLHVSNADIVEEVNKKWYRIESRCDNHTMVAGDIVHSFFYADTWQDVKGLNAHVKLTPYFARRDT